MASIGTSLDIGTDIPDKPKKVEESSNVPADERKSDYSWIIILMLLIVGVHYFLFSFSNLDSVMRQVESNQLAALENRVQGDIQRANPSASDAQLAELMTVEFESRRNSADFQSHLIRQKETTRRNFESKGVPYLYFRESYEFANSLKNSDFIGKLVRLISFVGLHKLPVYWGIISIVLCFFGFWMYNNFYSAFISSVILGLLMGVTNAAGSLSSYLILPFLTVLFYIFGFGAFHFKGWTRGVFGLLTVLFGYLITLLFAKSSFVKFNAHEMINPSWMLVVWLILALFVLANSKRIAVIVLFIISAIFSVVYSWIFLLYFLVFAFGYVFNFEKVSKWIRGLFSLPFGKLGSNYAIVILVILVAVIAMVKFDIDRPLLPSASQAIQRTGSFLSNSKALAFPTISPQLSYFADTEITIGSEDFESALLSTNSSDAMALIRQECPDCKYVVVSEHYIGQLDKKLAISSISYCQKSEKIFCENGWVIDKTPKGPKNAVPGKWVVVADNVTTVNMSGSEGVFYLIKSNDWFMSMLSDYAAFDTTFIKLITGQPVEGFSKVYTEDDPYRILVYEI